MSRRPFAIALALVLASGLPARPVRAQVVTPVPDSLRGRADAERSGQHDAARIRTLFWNFGMVGDYPPAPDNVDLSVFHSVEVPKGSGMNYSDGVTPFVLAKITDVNGLEKYIMETGFRERQEQSPYTGKIMRFEPRPGYFEPDQLKNRGRSPAISTDARTWPESWPDKGFDADDPGWPGSWNGYFGKRAAADQESFTVMDDQYYDAWDYYPDSRDSTRKGLGLRVQVRGFQWSNPQAGNVIFWHYDITNESTTDYDDNIIFGLYMDSGVGGSALSCDGIYESDDDNAYFDKSTGLNLVYTWDKNGHGRDLSGNCGRTGYLGYAYLETPGNKFDGIDDDNDGITDESRDGGPGQPTPIVGQGEIRAWVTTHYDLTKFEAAYGPLENRPAYKVAVWWTGDEDLDWTTQYSDVGVDGVAGTGDTGEGDGIPTEGEPNFDRTDLNESDQIGLTGFKMNRIKSGVGNPDPTSDNVKFYTDSDNWPEKLYSKFTDPTVGARFDSALAANYNLGFLFASGPFKLKAGQTERFSLALAYGADLRELRENVKTVQQIYNANYQFAVPPPVPTLSAEAGDGHVRLSWDDVAERGIDPVTNDFDFEGYRIYRSTDPDFLDQQVITTGNGSGTLSGNGKPTAQFDLVDEKSGYSRQTIDGVAYFLGQDTGITHTWTDTTVTNGQDYYYAVTAYDFGYEPANNDSAAFYPSENAIPISRTPRGGLILPKNAVHVRPEPRVSGFLPARASGADHVAGRGVGSVVVDVMTAINDSTVNDVFQIRFAATGSDSVRAERYALVDSTSGRTYFEFGKDFNGIGNGPVGNGMLPIVTADSLVRVASAGFVPGGPTNAIGNMSYQAVLSPNLRRPGYPEDIEIRFDDVVKDTGLVVYPVPARPAKFEVFALEPGGERKLDFAFRDNDNNGTLSRLDERIDVLTYPASAPTTPAITWRVVIDTTGLGADGPLRPPAAGDVFRAMLSRPLAADDVFRFTTTGNQVVHAAGQEATNQPYVVPNPYVGAASFEPARFATSGRGERRLEFRGIPQNAVVRIFTVKGDLVQTLRQDGSTASFVAWDLRSKDNLDIAPGLYIFQVEAPSAPPAIGKFAVIK